MLNTNINYIEILGIIASILIVLSALSKTTTFTGTIWLRSMNIVGSIAFILYGYFVNAFATMLCNIVMLIISIIYLIVEIKAHKTIIDNNNNDSK